MIGFIRKPRRIGSGQGIIHHIAVAIIALWVVRVRNGGVGGDHPAQFRVVDTPVHVDQATGQVFVAGKASAEPGGTGTAPLAKGIVAAALDGTAGVVGDGGKAAEDVGMPVVGLILAALAFDDDGDTAGDIEVVAFGADATGGLLFVEQALATGGMNVVGGAAQVLLLEALVVVVVGIGGGAAVGADGAGLVVAGPGEVAAVA